MTAAARSVNCGSCGAGQSVLGGGRVQALICAYCGITLDATRDFKPIGEPVPLDWPETPLEIGMTGRVAGVEVTVIGVLEHVERDPASDREWRWVDHQIYSPTHGYAWLTWENGWLTFTRKTRLAPDPTRISAGQIATAESPPTARWGGEGFVYYDSGVSEIVFAAGAFNFAPKRGDRAHAANMLGRNQFLSYVEALPAAKTPNEKKSNAKKSDVKELEWEVTELLDRDAVLASFGVDPASLPAKKGRVHPLQPFDRAPVWTDVRNAALVSAAFCLLAAIAVWLFSDGEVVARSAWAEPKAVHTLDFTVTDADRLVEVAVEANVDNSWAWFDVEVTDDEDEVVFEVERGVEFYHGYDEGEWTEGARRAAVYFKPPAPGDYRVEAMMTEQGGWSNIRGSHAATQARLTVSERISSSFPFLVASGVFALLGVVLLAQKWLHDMRRWSGGDWSDDE